MQATRQELEELETARWMRWLAAPMLLTAIFVGAAYATESQWLFFPVVLCVLTYPLIIWTLALSSDTVGAALAAQAESADAEAALDVAA